MGDPYAKVHCVLLIVNVRRRHLVLECQDVYSSLVDTHAVPRKPAQYWQGFMPEISMKSVGEAERPKGKAGFRLLEQKRTAASR
jgi:hypothetical protein